MPVWSRDLKSLYLIWIFDWLSFCFWPTEIHSNVCLNCIEVFIEKLYIQDPGWFSLETGWAKPCTPAYMYWIIIPRCCPSSRLKHPYSFYPAWQIHPSWVDISNCLKITLDFWEAEVSWPPPHNPTMVGSRNSLRRFGGEATRKNGKCPMTLYSNYLH